MPSTEPSAARLVVFSDDWGRHPSSSQHLVRRLLDRHPALWVNTIGTRSLRFSMEDVGKVFSRLRDWAAPPEQRPELPRNLEVISPRMWPGFRAGWQKRFNRNQIAKAVNRTLSRYPRKEHRIAVTTLPIMADVVDKIDVDRWVYYCVDDFSVWPGLDGGVMRDMERQLLMRVNRVVAVSDHLVQHVGKLGKPATLLTHGIDLSDWTSQISSPAQTAGSGSKVSRSSLPDWWPHTSNPIVLFWGLIDARLDTNWVSRIAGLATSKGTATVILVGPMQAPDPALSKLHGVLMPGGVAYEELPAMARAADVLVMPYRDMPATRAMQPLKFKEYLATGKPVVARNLPATLPWSDAADLVDSAERFAASVRERIETGMPWQQGEARLRLAGETWEIKAEQFRELLLGEDEGSYGRHSNGGQT